MPTTRPTSRSDSDESRALARSRAPWRLLRRDQTILYALCLVLVGALAARYAASVWPEARAVQKLQPGDTIDYRVDINRAGPAELRLLPHIGQAKAERIVSYREANGPFRTTSDLARVRGLSAATVEKIRGLIAAGTPASQGDSPE